MQTHLFQKSLFQGKHSTHAKRILAIALGYSTQFPAALFEDTLSKYYTLRLNINPSYASFSMYLDLWEQVPRYAILTTIMQESNPSLT